MPFLFPDRFQAFDLNVDRPTVMAILNVTPDSFSDGGRFNAGRESFDVDVEAVVDAARIAGISDAELIETLKALLELQEP